MYRAGSDENVDPADLMTEIMEKPAATDDSENADVSTVSMVDENEALYQAERLRKFAKKFGSPKAGQLLNDAKKVLFE